MEYEEAPEVLEREEAELRHLLLTADRNTAWVVAAALSRAYRSGRVRGRSEMAVFL